MKFSAFFYILVFIFFSQWLHGQAEAFPDTFCITSDETIVGNVKNNDFPVGNSIPVFLIPNSQQGNADCFSLHPITGVLTLNSAIASSCCGEHLLKYRYETPNGQMAMATISVTIKCPKPNCTLIDLNKMNSGSSGGVGNGKTIYYACEDTPVTYFTQYISGNSYMWSNTALAPSTMGSNAAEVIITWPNPGTYMLTLMTTSGTGTTTENFCIEVLAAPVASFTTAMNCVCLNSPISFTNTSTGASSYFWDFGDGNTSTMPNPTHMYGLPGTYTVTLYAYSQNYDPMGNPLCCCTDSTQMDITVDEKPGPDIYWISTLCEGDSSKYWTNASGCNFTWAVSGNGSIVSGQGNDTICVVWNAGPFGTITLTLSNCSPAIWCEKPVSVQVPIISSVETIAGEIKVCAGAKELYTLPKWAGTIYDWTVTGGMIVSGDSTHQITVMWGSGSSGSIHVDYWNPFLQGLPGHSEEDCKGVADLNVIIRPDYALLPHPSVVCVGDVTTISTDTLASPLGFTWTISPSITGFPLITNQSINVTWPNTGNYTICVYPNSITGFCNDTICTSVFVTDIDPIDSVGGEKIICPGQSYTYTAFSNESNVKYNWVVTGGSIQPAMGMGNPVMITWNNSGPYSISVSQTMLNSPFCTSTSIVCPVIKKQLNGPLTLTPGSPCINSTSVYSLGPSQPIGTSYQWSILPSTAGSISSGQNSPSVNIQWNNSAITCTLKCVVKICNDSLVLMQPITLKAPIPANISPSGSLCPGGSVTLSAGPGPYSTALWTPSNTGTSILVNAPGLYVVTTTDMMGCQSTDSYQLNALPGPLASISSAGPFEICTTAVGTPVLLSALTNPNYQYQWYLNSSPILGATLSTYTHISTGSLGIFNYQCKIMDTMTGCMSFSNTIIIIQSACLGGGGGNPCVPATHTVTLNLTPNTPLCEKFTFNFTNTGATITPLYWEFGDPFGVINNPGPVNAMFTYSKAGTFPVCLTYTVPDNSGTGTCTLKVCGTVDVPIVANFYTQLTQNCREVKFINSTSIQLGVSVTNYNWNFGDGNFYNTGLFSDMPLHSYLLPGTYTVILQATTSTGCISQSIQTVIVNGPYPASYTVSDDTVCVGDPVYFTFTGNPADVLSYLYDFGDASFNGGPNPSHTYLMAGLFNTSLIIVDKYNCSDTATQSIFVYPAYFPDTITYAPSLTVCAGNTVVLTSPGGPGFTYLWNTGQTTSAITVGNSGWYKVTVTDLNGCMGVTDSVEVTIIPPPSSIISGPTIVCDSGCITLNAPIGFNYTYQWFDENGDTIPFANLNVLQLCTGVNFSDSVFVVITDTTYFCTDTSAWWVLNVVTSPDVTINVVGNLCEGMPNILTAVASPPANVVFSWSTGDTGPTIIAVQAGSYTVYATDTLTGCSDNATVIVNPLPDLCILPSGCYEACNPDTLCGPPGMQSYQWNFNGSPIPGETNQCLEVSQSGSYSLTATNNFGCSATSDTLILILIPCCDEEDTHVTATPVSITGEECCYKFSYANSKDSILSITIHTTQANIQALAGSLPLPFMVTGFTSNTITIGNVTPGTPLPKDTLPAFITVCASNITSSPALILIDWNWPGYEALCQDSVYFNCSTSDTCVYVKQDTVLCRPNGGYIYQVQICNGAANTWSIQYVDIAELSPPGIVVTPGALAVNIPPGACQTLTFVLSGPGLANQNFCYNILAHEDNPVDNPNARCCSLDEAHCQFLPGCNPCDSVYLADIIINPEDSCCYTLAIVNYHNDNQYGGIGVCALDPSTVISLNKPPTSNWYTALLESDKFSLDYVTGPIPLDTILLPEFCLESAIPAEQHFEIKWLGSAAGQGVLCRDTFEVLCPGDCGYFEIEAIECTEGGFNISYVFHNMSPYTIYSASLNFTNPPLPGYNQVINFPGGVAPGNSLGPMFIALGNNVASFDTICVVTTLHNVENDISTSCCQFKSVFVLPDCDLEPPCECDESFFALQDSMLGVMINGLTVTFTPPAGLTPCDKVVWEFFYNQSTFVTYGDASLVHTFPYKGVFEVCATIIRITPDGKECKIKLVQTVKVKPAFMFKLQPNPASDYIQLIVETEANVEFTQHVEVFDSHGKRVMTANIESKNGGILELPIKTLLNGLYNVRITGEDNEVMYKRFIRAE